LPLASRLSIVRASTAIVNREIDKRMKASEGSTVIGKSVTIRGEVSGKEELYLDGVLEGTVTLPENRLTIGPNARVKADLTAGDIVIYGIVDGNIRAAGRIELRDSAVVTGDIVAERLSIEENATMKGKVELSDVAVRTSPSKRTDIGGAAPPASV
jgi:cytoskeletal protein CcmA (bactofilin family)